MIIDPPENPTLAPPDALNVCPVIAWVIEEVEPAAVLPTAVAPIDVAEATAVAPEIIQVPAENPTETPPVPDSTSAVNACVIEDAAPVVLPMTLSPIEVAEATVVAAAMIHVPAENPTEAPPEPE